MRIRCAPICTTLAAACPAIMAAIVAVLSTSRGGRAYDSMAGDYGKAFVAFGILVLTFAALLIGGVLLGAAAVLRRETPLWLARGVLALNLMLLAAALLKFR